MSRKPALYKAYLFKDKDPVIDELRTLVQTTYGKLNASALQKIKDAGGPSIGAMNGWFFGGIKRPQNPTIEAAGRAMGYRRKWVKTDGR
jgi:hypothetical protein